MKWQFGIREKFALVAIALVVVSAFILHKVLFGRTTDIVVEHELVDLQDEGDLNCWGIVSNVRRLRFEIEKAAKNPERLAEGITAISDFTNLKERSETQFEHLSKGGIRWWEGVLAVRSVNLADGKETPLIGPAGIAAPPVPAHTLHALKATAADKPVPVVSPILPMDVPVGFLSTRSTEGNSAEDHPFERVPVLWGLCRTENPDEAIAVLFPISRGTSPRHLTFILDEGGEFVQHPQIPKGDAVDLDDIYKDLDLHAEAQERIQNDRATGTDLNQLVHRGTLFKRNPVEENVTYFYLEGTATAELKAALIQEGEGQKILAQQLAEPDLSEEERAGIEQQIDDHNFFTGRWGRDIAGAMAKLDVRFGGPNITSGSFRLLGHSEESILEAKKVVDRFYDHRYPNTGNRVDWRDSIRHSEGDVYLSRFHLGLAPEEWPAAEGDEAGSDPAYYFVFAVFREELAFSIGTEFDKLRKEGIIFGLVAGVVAFLVALFFVRPLRAITKSAQHVTLSGDDTNQLQHKIEEVRQSLPIHKRDEVGDIARSLESLLRQVLNGHERLRQLNADLDGKVREQTHELREANAKLRGLAAAKDEFLASVSHELRQPLNSIFGYLQFLELSELDEEQKGDVEKTHLAATYLHRLINDILDYQKIIMGGMELEPGDFDAGEFLQNLKDTMKPQAAERRNEFVFEGTDSLGTLHNDRARLQQILINLLSNACKFTGDGTISLIAKRQEGTDGNGRVTIKVSDTGRGMKPEEIEQLFVKFKKLASKEGNKTGTGLGLVISKGLCELMGGTITCESEFGKGTTFTVDIPAVVPDAEEAPAVPSPPEKAVVEKRAATPDPGDHPLVLVIDDDTTVCTLMTRFLEGYGYRVISANDAESGLALAKEKRPAVITLDVVLPDIDGWEVLSDLKSEPETADIPVIMVTFIEEKNRGYTLGADDYLVKPVDWEDFSRRIRRVLGADGGDGPVLVVDDAPGTRSLFRRTLEQDGFDVLEAEHGKEALAKVEETRPSVIILDLMMPVMDGFEFIEQFRQNPDWRDIPVIVVTAKSTNSEDRQRLDGGVRAILNKGGSEQGNLLGNVLDLVHRHAPGAISKEGDSEDKPGEEPT